MLIHCGSWSWDMIRTLPIVSHVFVGLKADPTNIRFHPMQCNRSIDVALASSDDPQHDTTQKSLVSLLSQQHPLIEFHSNPFTIICELLSCWQTDTQTRVIFLSSRGCRSQAVACNRYWNYSGPIFQNELPTFVQFNSVKTFKPRAKITHKTPKLRRSVPIHRSNK